MYGGGGGGEPGGGGGGRGTGPNFGGDALRKGKWDPNYLNKNV